MVDRHYVWCSMVGSVTWDNVQNESHGFERNENKYTCVGRSKMGVDPPPPPPPPRVKDPNLLRLDMITGGESPSKVSERCATSGGVILKIRGPQMHKHTKFDQIK